MHHIRITGLLTALIIAGCTHAIRGTDSPRDAPLRKTTVKTKPLAVPGAPDPESFLEYRYFPSAEAALLHVISHTTPRIIGFGEYHNRNRTTARSALSRFTGSLLPAISPVTSDIVVEALVPEGGCGEAAGAVKEEVTAETDRPEATADETAALFRAAQSRRVSPHFITLSCRDHEAIYGERTVDYEALLTLIGVKLADKTKWVMGFRASRPARKKPLIVIYGGAVHNDLRPDPVWRAVTFGPTLQREVPPGKYVEVDLIVPELVEDNPFVRESAWYPLFHDKVDGTRTLLIKQRDSAYIIVFPKSA